MRNPGRYGNFLDLRLSVEMLLPPGTVVIVMFSQACVCSWGAWVSLVPGPFQRDRYPWSQFRSRGEYDL